MSAKKKKKSGNKALITLLLIVMFLFCVGMSLYPVISSWYSEQVHSEIQTKYEEVIAENDTSELDAIRQAAVEYNERLYNGQINLLDVESDGYFDQLLAPGTNVMCYVRIPCIDVRLPVYHGIGEDALQIGAGHFPQSSLPVGGVNTHAAISAHSGMASAEMFSNLELMEIGDIFFVDILGETLTYEVYAVDKVLPEDINSIKIERDKDLCTLITCTPYGINTHRLLVRGTRIETPEMPEEGTDETIPGTALHDTGSVRTKNYIKASCIGLGLALVIVLIAVIISKVRGNKHVKQQTRITWAVKRYGDNNGTDAQ